MRRPGPVTTSARRLAMAALLGALAIAWTAAGGTGTARADAPQVTIVSPGGAGQTLSLEALAGTEDVVGRAYTLRSSAGESAETVTGFSLSRLIEAAGLDPYGFSYLEVQRPGGGAVQLSSSQALEAGAFAEGPPVVYASATGTGFLRPSAGAGDDNGDDSFDAPQGLTIALRKGASLQVKVEASPRKTVPGKPVDFRAVVARSGSGEELAYSWYFDDGERAAGEAVTHSFAKPGSYSVVVGVTAAGEDTGASAVVRIQVGDPPPGPDREGGGHDRSAAAPDHGAAAGPSGRPSSTGSKTGAPEPTDSSAASTPPPPDVETPPSEASPPKRRHRSKPKEKSPPVKEPERRAKPSGPLVSGELLNGETVAASPPPSAKAPKPAAARTGTPRGGGGGEIPGVAIGLGAVAVLLGVGALAGSGRLVDLGPRLAERLR